MTTHTGAWRAFRRMQVCGALFGALIYAAAVLRAFAVLPDLPDPQPSRLQLTLLFPAGFFAASLLIPLAVGPLRRTLRRFVWGSFCTGFGQSVISVLGGIGVLAVAAGFVFAQIHGVDDGGRYPAGIFAAYAAGVGVLCAQLWLCLQIEKDPEFRPLIEA